MNTVSLVFSSTPIKGLIKDLKHFGIDFELSGIDVSHDINSKGKWKI